MLPMICDLQDENVYAWLPAHKQFNLVHSKHPRKEQI